MGSEPETKAIMEIFDKNNFYALVDYHSRGEIIYWHISSSQDEYNSEAKRLAEKISASNGYKLVEGVKEPATGSDGTTNDHSANYWEVPSLTIETTPPGIRFPIAKEQIKVAWDKNKFTGILAAEYALDLKNRDVKRYKAYQNNYLLHDFMSYEKAVEYASFYSNSRVEIDCEIVWESSDQAK